MGVIHLARVHDPGDRANEPRFLVERLWPRGVRHADLRFTAWVKGAGPSTELRRWFGPRPELWDEFRRRYFAELDGCPEAWRPLRDAAVSGDVTLLYSSRDTEHDNAVALREYLRTHLAAATP
ncbi:MAG TPA: DUF488 family protein [Blastococcus sp.]|nr:DUF488 family protein [Blastococcus sp.]